MKSLKAIVTGSGIAGIATAIRLAVKGYQVSVFEANEYLGGKLTAFENSGYRFDSGPSLFTLPYLVDDLFKLANKNPKDYFNYQKIDTACHYFWEDGTTLLAHADKNQFENEVEKQLGVEPNVLREKLNHAKLIHEKTGKIFMEKSLHKLSTWLTKDVLRALGNIFSYDIFNTMHGANLRLNNKKLVQLFDRYATYNGSSPYMAPGIMNVIPHLEHGIGTFLPVGGMHQITLSLVKLAEELEVKFQTNAKVEKVEIENGKAKSVLVNGKELQADLIVSNIDVVPTYRKLLPQLEAPEKTLQQERSSSALIFYWGIKKEFKQLGLHNILFSEDYKTEFDHLFKHYTLYNDPTVYINITSKYEKQDAPQGCENWFVMINAPSNKGQNWDEIIPEARKNILQKVSRILNQNIEELIEFEEILEPRTIESKTSSYQGALYGAASNNRYAAFLRHPNFHRKIENLFFVGGSVHPGGGIPLCLLSAKIVDDLTPGA